MVILNDIGEDCMTKEEGSANAAGETGPTFKLSLTGEGVTVEREVAGDVARDIIAVVLGGGIPRGVRSTAPSATGLSIREFIDETGAKKNPQIVTAIGQYLIDHEGQERFTRGDLKARFAQAGEPMPANLSRDVALAVSS